MKRTLISIEVPIYNEEGEPINKEGKVCINMEEPAKKKKYFYLLHWGEKSSLIYSDDNEPLVITETVVFAQNQETYYIEALDPTAIKIEGEIEYIERKAEIL